MSRKKSVLLPTNGLLIQEKLKFVALRKFSVDFNTLKRLIKAIVRSRNGVDGHNAFKMDYPAMG